MPALDLTVLIAYFLGITAYGLWVARRTKTSDQYFRGGRSFKWWRIMELAFGTGTHAKMPVTQARASFHGGFATICYQWEPADYTLLLAYCFLVQKKRSHYRSRNGGWPLWQNLKVGLHHICYCLVICCSSRNFQMVSNSKR